jgi:hypothetical protein
MAYYFPSFFTKVRLERGKKIFDKLLTISVNYLFLFFGAAFVLILLGMFLLWKFKIL